MNFLLNIFKRIVGVDIYKVGYVAGLKKAKEMINKEIRRELK